MSLKSRLIIKVISLTIAVGAAMVALSGCDPNSNTVETQSKTEITSTTATTAATTTVSVTAPQTTAPTTTAKATQAHTQAKTTKKSSSGSSGSGKDLSEQKMMSMEEMEKILQEQGPIQGVGAGF